MARAPSKTSAPPAIRTAAPDAAMVPQGLLAPSVSPLTGVLSPQVMPTTAMPASTVGLAEGMAAPAYGSDLYSPYGDIANIFASAGYLSENPSSSPLSAYDGQQGYQFVTNRNKMAGTKANPTGYVTADPNAQYRFVNLRGDDNVMYEGVGEEGLRNVYDLARQQSTDLGKKAYWSAERYDPATESWVSVADDPRGGLKGAVNKYGDLVLPALAAMSLAIPGFQPFAALGLASGSAGAAGLAAGLGSVASSAAQGRGLGSTLGRALMTGGLAYGGASLAPAISGALSAPTSAATNTATSEVAKAALSEGAKQALGQVAPQIIGDTMILTGAREAAKAALPAVVGGALGGAGGGVLPKLPATGSKAPTTSSTSNPEDTLVVTGQRPLTPFEQAFSAWLPTAAETPTPTTNPDDPIVVTGERADPVVDKLVAAGVPATVAGGVALDALTGTQAPVEKPVEKPAGTPSTLEEISTWLDRIGLTSTVLGALADAVRGGGGGAAGTTTPYTSILGPAPSFGRGAFTPYTGNYETYGFGPEFSFFGQAPAQTTTGPMASLLNPALPVNNTLLA